MVDPSVNSKVSLPNGNGPGAAHFMPSVFTLKPGPIRRWLETALVISDAPRAMLATFPPDHIDTLCIHSPSAALPRLSCALQLSREASDGCRAQADKTIHRGAAVQSVLFASIQRYECCDAYRRLLRAASTVQCRLHR